jgi:uncharacterized protein (TIGR00303 family)
LESEPILFVTAVERGRAFADRWRGVTPAFWCVLAHTDTCLLPGISSAGLSEELRPLTPAADAEVLLLGAPACLPILPSNPLGTPGPAGITRAALQLARIEPRFIGAGLRVWPETDCLRVSDQSGRRIDLGESVSDADALFEVGLRLGRQVSAPYLVLAESVPGGTTTALAVLLGLGYAAEGRVSGSSPGNAHELKTRVARAALRAANLKPGDGRADPLLAVGRVGDPMQPVAAGVALGAARSGCDVLLAGGSQMVAVAALLQELGGEAALERVAVGTTRWVVEDPSADVPGLVAEVSGDLPLLASNLDFSASRHIGLREYESFIVKEGVGAGGACIAAALATGATLSDLYAAIDAAYDGLVGRLQTSAASDRRGGQSRPAPESQAG